MKIRILGGLALALLVILQTGCAKQVETPGPVRPVQTLRIADADQLGRRAFPGRAEATLAVDMAFEVQGLLTERPVRVGDVVPEGQMLARVDPRDYQNDVDAAEARVERTQAFLERIQEAAKTGAVAQQDLTDAEAQHNVATANLSIAQKALDDTRMVAPFEGVVSATYVETFQNVQRKQAVLRLLDTSRIEFKIDVPEQLISNIGTVEDIEVVFETFRDQPVPAEIVEIGNEASATTRTFPVTLIMDQPKEFTILPGMSGRARGLPNPPGDLLKVGHEVPGEAILEEDGRAYIWLVDEASSTVRRQEVGLNGIGVLGVRVKGLDPGQLVITAGAHYLREGQKVRVPDLSSTPGDAS